MSARFGTRLPLTAEIGIGLVAVGVFFLFLGVVMLLDSSLMALGNVSQTRRI